MNYVNKPKFYKPCIICGYSLFLKKKINNYFVAFCRTCGTGYTIVRRGYDVKKFNENYYNNKYLSKYHKSSSELLKRNSIRLKEIERHKRGGNILDIGCSTGLFLETITNSSKYHWLTYGVDINKRSIKIGKSLGIQNLYNGRLINIPFRKNYFDCISCIDVLEHDDKLINSLIKIKSLLKTNGLLVLQFPNTKSIINKICGNYWDWWSVPDHLYHFNFESSKKLVEKFGFTIYSIKTYDSKNDFIFNLKRKLYKGSTSPPIFNKIITNIIITFIKYFWFIIEYLIIHKNMGGLTILYAFK